MNWNVIRSDEDLNEAISTSKYHAVLIFKHSTRCSISSAALDRLERNWKSTGSEQIKPYFLDLISHRAISNRISEISAVRHESPQALVFSNEKCIYHASHMGISLQEILNQLPKP